MYVSSLKTWGEAQTYCRRKYTELATFENTKQINQLINAVSSVGKLSDIWIGLVCGFKELWLDLFEGSILDWENQARNDPLIAYHFCGSISKDGFGYENWSVEHPFICRNGEHTAKRFPLS